MLIELHSDLESVCVRRRGRQLDEVDVPRRSFWACPARIQRDLVVRKVEVHLEARGLIVSLRQKTFFPSGGDEIAPESYRTLEKIASMLSAMPNPIRLEGHTDAIPIHTDRFRSNWELSAARSIAMLEVLSGRFGIPRARFGISGYADTAPIDTNETEEGRAHNRRGLARCRKRASSRCSSPGRVSAT